MDLLTLGIGGLIGFLSAIGKDFFLEHNKNKVKIKDFKRQKLEEIFILMDKVTQETIKPLKYKKSLDGVGAKLGMIIRFYFPELNEDYKEFLQIFQKISQKTITLDENVTLSTHEITSYYEVHRVFINKVVEESKKYV
jgi:hypothetical protein